jgi:hypothetical protein
MKETFLVWMLLIHVLLAGSSSSSGSPGTPIIPMNNLYTTNIASQDLITFSKIGGGFQSWSSVISSFPVQQNATTSFTVKILSISNTFILGCGRKNANLLGNMFFGQTADTIGFYARNGLKHISNIGISYGVSLNIGDSLTMKIDLHP